MAPVDSHSQLSWEVTRPLRTSKKATFTPCYEKTRYENDLHQATFTGLKTTSASLTLLKCSLLTTVFLSLLSPPPPLNQSSAAANLSFRYIFSPVPSENHHLSGGERAGRRGFSAGFRGGAEPWAAAALCSAEPGATRLGTRRTGRTDPIPPPRSPDEQRRTGFTPGRQTAAPAGGGGLANPPPQPPPYLSAGAERRSPEDFPPGSRRRSCCLLLRSSHRWRFPTVRPSLPPSFPLVGGGGGCPELGVAPPRCSTGPGSAERPHGGGWRYGPARQAEGVSVR